MFFVIYKRPSDGDLCAIMSDYGELASWATKESAEEFALNHHAFFKSGQWIYQIFGWHNTITETDERSADMRLVDTE